MHIHVVNDQSLVSIENVKVQQLVEAFLSLERLHYDEVAIHFIDTKTMCEMHAEFFDDPSPTDCMSFPIDDPENDDIGYKIMGDIFVCPETALDYVKEHGGHVDEEITLYTIHGLLHLIGYDDIEEDDRAAMRAAEVFHIESIRAKDLWLKTKIAS